MKKIIFFLLIASLLLPLFSFCALGAASPANAKIAAAEDALSSCVGSDTAGAGIVILENGAVTMLDGAGYADLGEKKVVTAETVFEIGDLSGVFVALAAFRCRDAGVLDLDADIAKYLTEKEMKALALRYPVSVRQLLLSTAGFAGRSFDVTVSRPSLLFSSLGEAVFADVPPQVLKPDTAVSFSPFGVSLAALVVERASGVAYDEYVKTEILAPLGMRATYLFDDGETAIDRAALGYTKTAAGVFAEGERKGRTLAGLYPACGALSSLGDLSILLTFLAGGDAGESVLSRAARAEMFHTLFQNGVFGAVSPALGANGGQRFLTTQTAYFTLSLVFDASAKSGALIVTNTAGSALSALPQTLFYTGSAVSALPEGELLEVKKLSGLYRSLSEDGHTFAGRLARRDTAIEIKAGDDGTLTVGERTYKQIARGVFADVEKEDEPALQFLINDEGEVKALLTAKGETLTRAPFYARPFIENLLFYLLLFFSLWFFFGGFVSLFRWKFRRERSFGDGFLYILPDLGSSVIALSSLIQILAAITWGSSAVLSLFRVLSVFSLVVAIGVMVGYLLTLAATLTDKKIFHRSVRNALFFVAFALLLYFWGLTPM